MSLNMLIKIHSMVNESDYGENAEWWDGKLISFAFSTSVDWAADRNTFMIFYRVTNKFCYSFGSNKFFVINFHCLSSAHWHLRDILEAWSYNGLRMILNCWEAASDLLAKFPSLIYLPIFTRLEIFPPNPQTSLCFSRFSYETSSSRCLLTIVCDDGEAWGRVSIIMKWNW